MNNNNSANVNSKLANKSFLALCAVVLLAVGAWLGHIVTIDLQMEKQALAKKAVHEQEAENLRKQLANLAAKVNASPLRQKVFALYGGVFIKTACADIDLSEECWREAAYVFNTIESMLSAPELTEKEKQWIEDSRIRQVQTVLENELANVKLRITKKAKHDAIAALKDLGNREELEAMGVPGDPLLGPVFREAFKDELNNEAEGDKKEQ